MEDTLLPENILFDILTRLPVKSIINCKCVCRKWRELVSDTYFVRLHLLRSRQCLLIHDCFDIISPGTLLWAEIEGGYFDIVKILDLKRYSFIFRISQFSSLNGLICCYCAYGSICILNPVLEEYMILRSSSLSSLITLCYGFGVSTKGEYKVIRICVRRVFGNLDETKDCAIETEVYTIGTRHWRIVGQNRFTINLTINMVFGLSQNGPDRGVYLDCHLYWLLSGQIYSFDLITETLELFPSPPDRRGKSGRMLGVLKGCLSCISWCCLGFDVWVMKGEAWCKEISIQENVRVNLASRNWIPMCLTDGLNGGSILMVYNKRETKLLVYCLDANRILKMNSQGYCNSVVNYCPSFVTLADFKYERVQVLQNRTRDVSSY